MRSTSRTGPAAVSDAAPAAAPWIGGGTRTVGVIGWPVSHSLSPLIHNAAFAALEMDWAYVPLPVPPGNVLEALMGLRALGFAGANVTMPHKTEIAALADELTDDARLLSSVNTLVVTTDGIVGHNTDCPGFDRFITRDAGFAAADKTALLFGAGGGARACAYGGLGLLLHQAGLAFELWTGRPAPLDVMSAAAMTELAATGRGETPEG